MSVVVKVGAELGPNADGSATRFERFKSAAGNVASAAAAAAAKGGHAAGNFGLHSACDASRVSDLKSAELYAMKTGNALSDADYYKIQTQISKAGGFCKSNRLQEFEKNKIHPGSTVEEIESEMERLTGRRSSTFGADGAEFGGKIPPQFMDRIRRERAMGKDKGCKSCMGAGPEISL